MGNINCERGQTFQQQQQQQQEFRQYQPPQYKGPENYEKEFEHRGMITRYKEY